MLNSTLLRLLIRFACGYDRGEGGIFPRFFFREDEMKCLNVLAYILVVLGALNWGLWGFFQFDFVAWACGGNTVWLSRFVYSIVGLAGVWSLRMIPRCKHLCCDTEHCKKGRGK